MGGKPAVCRPGARVGLVPVAGMDKCVVSSLRPGGE